MNLSVFFMTKIASSRNSKNQHKFDCETHVQRERHTLATVQPRHIRKTRDLDSAVCKKIKRRFQQKSSDKNLSSTYLSLFLQQFRTSSTKAMISATIGIKTSATTGNPSVNKYTIFAPKLS